MGEPLDAATLAEIENGADPLQPTYRAWVTNADIFALLAVARDHARLTTEVKTLRGLLRSIGYGNVVNLLSAEAGDTDG